MPKLTLRDDGTCFVKAVVIPGTSDVRTWEVKPQGIVWLRQQRGIGVGQEMGRGNFQSLLSHGYAYVANRPEKKPARRTTTKPVQSTVSRPHSWRVTEQAIREAKLRTKAKTTIPDRPVVLAETSSEQDNTPSVTPMHWQRRTAKKDWFK